MQMAHNHSKRRQVFGRTNSTVHRVLQNGIITNTQVLLTVMHQPCNIAAITTKTSAFGNPKAKHKAHVLQQGFTSSKVRIQALWMLESYTQTLHCVVVFEKHYHTATSICSTVRKE